MPLAAPSSVNLPGTTRSWALGPHRFPATPGGRTRRRPKRGQKPLASLPESPLLPGAFEQSGGHRDTWSLPVDEVVHEHVEQWGAGRLEPE